jgi:glycosyltransferase involved in cell wall biosynthesis
VRVLYILNELRYSGAETKLAAAADWFRNEQIEMTILSTGERIGPFAETLRRCGYVLEHIPFRKRLRFFLSVRSLIRTGNFDIVHIHSERAYPFYAGIAWPIPTVRETGHLFQHRGALRVRKIVERAVCQHVFGVMQVSSTTAEQRNERIRFWSNTTFVNCCWYNDAKYRLPSKAERNGARDLLGLSEDDFLIVSLGSNVVYKNYDLIIKAVQLLPAQLPIKYLHIGNEGEEEPLSALAKQLGVKDKTMFPGRVDDAVRYLWAADCYIMPSREEGFGIAAVEAMATGLPAILSRRPALTDFARYMDGIIYAEPNVEELALQMMLVYFRPQKERWRIGAQLAAAVRANFAVENGAGAYLSIYNTLLRRRSGDVSDGSGAAASP